MRRHNSHRESQLFSTNLFYFFNSMGSADEAEFNGFICEKSVESKT